MASSIAAISITLGFSRYGQWAIIYCLRLYSNPAETSECREGMGAAVQSARNTPRDYGQNVIFEFGLKSEPKQQ